MLVPSAPASGRSTRAPRSTRGSTPTGVPMQASQTSSVAGTRTPSQPDIARMPSPSYFQRASPHPTSSICGRSIPSSAGHSTSHPTSLLPAKGPGHHEIRSSPMPHGMGGSVSHTPNPGFKSSGTTPVSILRTPTATPPFGHGKSRAASPASGPPVFHGLMAGQDRTLSPLPAPQPQRPGKHAVHSLSRTATPLPTPQGTPEPQRRPSPLPIHTPTPRR